MNFGCRVCLSVANFVVVMVSQGVSSWRACVYVCACVFVLCVCFYVFLYVYVLYVYACVCR